METIAMGEKALEVFSKLMKVSIFYFILYNLFIFISFPRSMQLLAREMVKM
jgi:hypothetical protein